MYCLQWRAYFSILTSLHCLLCNFYRLPCLLCTRRVFLVFSAFLQSCAFRLSDFYLFDFTRHLLLESLMLLNAKTMFFYFKSVEQNVLFIDVSLLVCTETGLITTLQLLDSNILRTARSCVSAGIYDVRYKGSMNGYIVISVIWTFPRNSSAKPYFRKKLVKMFGVQNLVLRNARHMYGYVDPSSYEG